MVDSVASLHIMGLSSLNKKEKSNILDIQTRNGIVASDTQAKVYIKELGACPWVHLVEDSPSVLSLGRHAMSLVVLIRGRQEKLPDYQKVKMRSNAATKTSSPW